MKVKNVSTEAIYLPFVPVTIQVGQTVEIDNSFIYHPQMASLINTSPSPIAVSDVEATSTKVTAPSVNQKEAMDRAKNPSASNEFITSTDYSIRLGRHAKELSAHHNNTNDPSTNQKEAMDQAAAASGHNPFSTIADKIDTIDASIVTHLSEADHSPPSLTESEIAGIKAATALSDTNAAVSVSFLASDTASKIGAHASDAVAHHSNVSDPDSDEKAAMVAANAPATGNAFQVASDMSSHIATATAHHSDVNDPSLNQKGGMDAASPAITAGNPVVTAGDNGLMSTDEAAAMAAANPALTAANPAVGEDFPGVSVTNHLTVDQRESLEGAGVAPTGANPILTEGSDRILSTDEVAGITGAASLITGANPVVASDDARLLTSDQKDAADGADTPTSGNPFGVVSDMTTHIAVTAAHHNNTNDLTTDQKAAATNADAPASGNPFGVVSDMTTHIAVSTAHHSNANDLTGDQKDAVDGADTPTSGNPFGVVSDMTTHIAVATAHHNNTNDPSTDEKASLDGTSGTPPSGANKLVDNADTRMADDRDPTTHAGEHVDGTDDIRLANITQKGLMSSAFAIQVELCKNNKNDCKVVRNSTTQLSLEGVRSKTAYVNGEVVSLAADETLLTSANLIDAAGQDTSAAMTTSTLYYLYLSSSEAFYAPVELRASTTAPTYDSTNDKEMLATTGNGQHWMFVGWAITNGSTQFLNVLSVASRYNSEPEILTMQGSGTVNASGDNTWETITGVESTVLLPPGWTLNTNLSMPCEHSSIGIAMLIGVRDGSSDTDIVEAETCTADSQYALAGSVPYKNSTSTPTKLLYSARHKYSTASGSATSADKGRFSLARNPA